jgi:hypothetical protein
MSKKFIGQPPGNITATPAQRQVKIRAAFIFLGCIAFGAIVGGILGDIDLYASVGLGVGLIAAAAFIYKNRGVFSTTPKNPWER